MLYQQDWILFSKKLFTENKDMLHSFVASMLDVPQESISDIVITIPSCLPKRWQENS